MRRKGKKNGKIGEKSEIDDWCQEGERERENRMKCYFNSMTWTKNWNFLKEYSGKKKIEKKQNIWDKKVAF